MASPNDPPPHPDQQFVELLRENDPKTWRTVYETNRPKVINFLRRRNAPDEVALDIYQETLIFLDSRKHTLTLSCKLSVYLIGVALNKWRDYRKKTNGREQSTDDADLLDRRMLGEDEADAAELALLNQAFVNDPLLWVDTSDPSPIIQKALGLLSLTCQRLLTLRYWDDLDDQQISETVPMAYDAVRKQIYKCKQKIREILRDLGWGK